MLVVLLALACTPSQLQSAGQRVQGKGPVEQAWILADVGCFELARGRLDGVLQTAEGQHRLHALFTRGRIAARQCKTACPDAVRTRGRAALQAVIRTARAPGQVDIARAMLKRLRPPDVVVSVPISSAPPAPLAVEKQPASAPPAVASARSIPSAAPRGRLSTGLWWGAGAALVGSAAMGLWSWRTHQDTQRLSAARSTLECGGRSESACRSAWQESHDHARLQYGASLGLGALSVGLGVAAWWTGRAPTVQVGHRGLSVGGVW